MAVFLPANACSRRNIHAPNQMTVTVFLPLVMRHEAAIFSVSLSMLEYRQSQIRVVIIYIEKLFLYTCKLLAVKLTGLKKT